MPNALLTDNKKYTAIFKPLFDALNRAAHARKFNKLPDNSLLKKWQSATNDSSSIP